jgi:hypothetical protein
MDFFAHKTSSYDEKMLLEIVFDETAFVKFKINIKFKQKIDETHPKQPKSIGKSIPACGFKNLKKKNPKTKSLETFAKYL